MWSPLQRKQRRRTVHQWSAWTLSLDYLLHSLHAHSPHNLIAKLIRIIIHTPARTQVVTATTDTPAQTPVPDPASLQLDSDYSKQEPRSQRSHPISDYSFPRAAMPAKTIGVPSSRTRTHHNKSIKTGWRRVHTCRQSGSDFS
jgi:hypothetical protein